MGYKKCSWDTKKSGYKKKFGIQKFFVDQNPKTSQKYKKATDFSVFFFLFFLFEQYFDFLFCVSVFFCFVFAFFSFFDFVDDFVIF